MTALQVNDLVKSTTNSQGMTRGVEYIITAVSVQSLPFGDFVSYRLSDVVGVDIGWIRNGHLLLERVAVENIAAEQRADCMRFVERL